MTASLTPTMAVEEPSDDLMERWTGSEDDVALILLDVVGPSPQALAPAHEEPPRAPSNGPG